MNRRRKKQEETQARQGEKAVSTERHVLTAAVPTDQAAYLEAEAARAADTAEAVVSAVEAVIVAAEAIPEATEAQAAEATTDTEAATVDTVAVDMVIKVDSEANQDLTTGLEKAEGIIR